MFPVDPVVVKIEFAFGADLKANPATWVYVDRTADWQPDRDLAATIGRADAASKPPPAKLGFWLKNVGGKYTKGNAMSPYWPYIRKNTPVRVTIDPGTGHTRVYEMYVTQWLPRWGTSGDSGRQPLVQVVANGIRRRLTQGSSPLRSALFGTIKASNPVAWWPLEDGTDSTQAASGLVGGTPMTVATGIMDFVDDNAPVGATGSAKPVVSADNNLSAAVVGGSASAWQVSIWARGLATNPALAAYFIPVEVRTDNGGVYRLVMQNFNPTVGLALFDTEDSTTYSFQAAGSGIAAIDGAWHLSQATLLQLGSDAVVSFYFDGQLIDTETWTGVTIGKPIRVSSIGRFAGPSGQVSQGMQEISVAHIALHNTATLVDLYQAGLGYAGETATDRMVRLCAENGVAAVVSTAATARMGPQRPVPFVGLLDECAEVDGGILLDGLNPGFTYLARSDAYNLPVALTIDMASRQFRAPFEPRDDDSEIVNDQTVNRTDGSSARFVDPDSVAAIERYDSSATLNVYSDADLPGQAAWRTHLGTAGTDGYRFPGVGFDLHTAAGSALIEPWLTSGVRKRVQAINPPAEYGPGPIDLLIEGYTETVRSRRVLQVQANASPYDPWLVFVLDQDRLDADPSSQLVAGVAVGAATFQVQTANIPGAAWTTDPTQFPFDVTIGGIKVTVTAITGATSPQTFTVNPATVTKALTAGTYVGLWQPRVLAL